MLKELEEIKLSVILPTYNERENLIVLVDELNYILEKNVEYEIIIVDDNSPDGTGHLADELSRKSENIRVLHRPKKLGLTSALIAGLKMSNGDLIAISDADLQHSPKMLVSLLNEIIHGADLVIASRYIDGGSVGTWSPWRRIVSMGATLLAHALLPITGKVKDPLSGYFIFKRQVVNGTELSGIGWKILLEILVKNNGTQNIIEVPYVFTPRRTGNSKLKLKDYLDYLSLIFKLKRSNH
jgi:dolichol-phosphate mannosyltransferase